MFGEYEEVETVNWEEAFKKHIEETARTQKEKNELLEKKERTELGNVENLCRVYQAK